MKTFDITFSQTVAVQAEREEDVDIDAAFIKAQEIMSINGPGDCFAGIEEYIEGEDFEADYFRYNK